MILFHLSLILIAGFDCVGSFSSYSSCFCRQRFVSSSTNQKRSSKHEVNMLFEFFRERSQEGIAQVKNIATKTLQGKLGEALQDSADYVRDRNRIDAENLKQLTLGLSRSRDRLLGGISESFQDEDLDIKARLEKLEDTLLQADFGSSTTSVIIEDLRNYAKTEDLKVDDILPVLRARLIEALTPPTLSQALTFAPASEAGPTVIFVIGANGMGKTTTIGKIASRLKNELNMTVLLGACDTFRAAAVEQLNEWANRANVSIEVPTVSERGGDPVPVVTRSVKRAKEEGFDVVIIDTSGRLSNNFELTVQLQSMKAAIQKEIPSAPHETLLVVDGSLGRNAVEQASAWRKYVGVSGLVITKLDGTARGGFVVSVVKDLGLPVKFIGIGEKITDLRDFQADLFVDALLGNDIETSRKLEERMQKMMGLSSASTISATGTTSSNSIGESTDPAARLRAAFAANGGSSNGNSSNGNTSPGVQKSSSEKKPKKKPQKVIQKKKGK